MTPTSPRPSRSRRRRRADSTPALAPATRTRRPHVDPVTRLSDTVRVVVLAPSSARWLAAAAIAACVTSACQGQQVGALCEEDADCASGQCLDLSSEALSRRICTRPCVDDTACGGSLRCGVGPTGERQCVPGCGSIGFTCVDGVSTSCAAVAEDETRCGDCGCGRDRPRCVPEVGCFARSEVGGPCRWDGDCRTNHCSDVAHLCRVAVGQPCTTDDCDLCMRDEEGWSYCTRRCFAGGDVCNGDPCLAPSSLPSYGTCRPRCLTEGADPACPAQCRRAGTGQLYCECEDPDCATVAAPRRMGHACSQHAECASGLCLASQAVCSGPCAGDAECENGTLCVRYECAEGQTEGCGDLCIGACPSTTCATCRALTRPEGGVAEVCDPRRVAGESCVASTDCLSGRCADAVCVGTDELQNGSPCLSDPECLSGRCVSAHCRGEALLGDACLVDPDCAVGRCCDERCESSCP